MRSETMRQRVILGTKLFETVARGVFVLSCTYRLPLVDAGQFGLGVTLIGLDDGSQLSGLQRLVDNDATVADGDAAQEAGGGETP